MCYSPIRSWSHSSPLLLLKLPDGREHLISGLVHSQRSALRCEALRVARCGRVDLGGGEPGQRGEHVVEQVLPHVDHDVLVLEDAVCHRFVVLESRS